VTDNPKTSQPDMPRWARRWDDALTAREARRDAAIEAIGRFLSTVIDARKTCVEARLQLARDLGAARFAFRRTLVHNAVQRLA
jgi:hypothetical protein